MRLLIVTQAVDRTDPVLGFFHAWITAFAQHCEKVTVVCLRKGEYDLPANVSVYSLGKESGRSRLKYIARFYRYIWKFRHEYDAVFVHMNPEYSILGGLLWRLWRKRVGLWYVHRASTMTMRVGTWMSHLVFTSAKKSFGIESRKLRVVGHGIDTRMFSTAALPEVDARAPRILFVGRISPIKGIETCIQVLGLLRERGLQATMDIYGEPLMAGDDRYFSTLQDLVQRLALQEFVHFRGPIANNDLPRVYASHSILMNASPTGGMDKVVLEATAAGLPVFLCNESFKDYLEELPSEFIGGGEAEDFARRIQAFLQRSDIKSVQESIRDRAAQRADVSALIPAIIELYGADR